MNRRAGLFFVLFVLYAGVRLVPFFFVFDNTARFFLAGSSEYSERGADIAQHDSSAPVWPGTAPARTPGYPFFLSMVYRAFGVKPAIALFFQIVLSGLVPIFLYLNAEFLLSRRVARIASFLSVFEPLSIVYATVLLPWTIGTLLLLVSTYFLIVSLKKKDTVAFFLSAVVVGAAAYVLPVMFYVPLVYAAVYIAASWLPLRDRLKYALGIIVVAGLTLSPWVIGNYTVSGYKGFCPAPLAVTARGAASMLSVPLRGDVSHLVGIKPVPGGPVLRVHHAHGAGSALLSGPSIVEDVVVYQDVFAVVTAFLAIMGIVIVAGEGFLRELFLLLLMIAYPVVVSEGPATGPGNRLAMLPYVLILTSAGISALFTSVSSKHYKKRIK